MRALYCRFQTRQVVDNMLGCQLDFAGRGFDHAVYGGDRVARHDTVVRSIESREVETIAVFAMSVGVGGSADSQAEAAFRAALWEGGAANGRVDANKAAQVGEVGVFQCGNIDIAI